MYHGISAEETQEWTQLSVKRFHQQMAYLKKKYNVITLKEAINYINNKATIPPHSIVITFDDGYKSNFTLARSILDKYKLPATVFVTTSFIHQENEAPSYLWFDQIYQSFLTTKINVLDLKILQMSNMDLSTKGKRIAASEAVIGNLKELSVQSKNELVKEIVSILGPIECDNPCYQGATWTDIKKSSYRISIGAHTINHEILSRLSLTDASEEIVKSKSIIETATGLKVDHFAYPNGRFEDFNIMIVNAVKSAHYEGAVTTIEGINCQNDDVFTLKRIAISSDIDYINFKLLVSGTINFLKKITR